MADTSDEAQVRGKSNKPSRNRRVTKPRQRNNAKEQNEMDELLKRCSEEVYY